MICPICHCELDEDKTLTLPFCSQRCRNVDLGRWLNEEYGMLLADGLVEEEEVS